MMAQAGAAMVLSRCPRSGAASGAPWPPSISRTRSAPAGSCCQSGPSSAVDQFAAAGCRARRAAARPCACAHRRTAAQRCVVGPTSSPHDCLLRPNSKTPLGAAGFHVNVCVDRPQTGCTSCTSGQKCLSRFSMPWRSVAVELGQPAQAPRMCREHDAVLEAVEGDVAAVVGDGRAHARVQQLLDGLRRYPRPWDRSARRRPRRRSRRRRPGAPDM